MKTKKLIMSLFVPFMAFLIILTLHNLTKTAAPEAAATKETYIVTYTDSEGIEGTSRQNTGVYITKSDLSKLSKEELKIGDQIKVTFADYETILEVEKVN